MRRMLGLAVTLVLTVALAACADEGGGDDPDGPVAAEFTIPVGNPTYDVDAATWALRTSIHVGPDELSADAAPDAYVVTRAGIYYLSDGKLYFTDGGDSEKIERVDSAGLVISPDGRYLALIDAAHGPVDPYDTHVAVPVVFDLRTGEQVFRGEPGRSVEDDDLTVLYGQIPPTVLGLDEEAVYALDPLQDGDDDAGTRFPLDDSEPTPVDGDPQLQDEMGFRGYAERLPGGRFRWVPTFTDEAQALYPAVLSPARSALFVTDQPGRYHDPTTGEPTVFSETPFTLGGWIDDDTFYGAFSDRGSIEGPSGATTIASCDVGPQPECVPLAPRFELPNRPTLVFGTGKVPML